MSSFMTGIYAKEPITHPLMQAVAAIARYSGQEELYRQQRPQELDMLRRIAIVNSTESSNRIEGIEVEGGRLIELMDEKTTPRGRAEHEIAGYRRALELIHANHASMELTLPGVLELHKVLYSFYPQEGGQFKATDNRIVTVYPNGTKVLRFAPVLASETPRAMEELHELFNDAWTRQEVDKLLLIPAYVLDFLCIHPFPDGNGRMSRLLTLLLLYKAGYGVGRYISLEKIIEQTKDQYYETLRLCSQGWHEAAHPLGPWREYFLGVVMLAAYKDLEARMGVVSQAPRRSDIKEIILALPGETFAVGDIVKAAPAISMSTIKRALAEMKAEGRIALIGAGRDAKWKKLR